MAICDRRHLYKLELRIRGRVLEVTAKWQSTRKDAFPILVGGHHPSWAANLPCLTDTANITKDNRGCDNTEKKDRRCAELSKSTRMQYLSSWRPPEGETVNSIEEEEEEQSRLCPFSKTVTQIENIVCCRSASSLLSDAFRLVAKQGSSVTEALLT